MKTTLRRSFSSLLIGNVGYGLSQWAMLTVLAKIGGPGMVGQFALALAITAPVIMFARMQLRAVQATDAHGEYRLGDYLWLRLISLGVALVVIGLAALVVSPDSSVRLVIMLMGLAKAVEAVGDLLHGSFQRLEQMDRIAKSLLLKGPASALLLGVAAWLTGDLVWGVVGLLTAWLLVLVSYDLRLGLTEPISFQWKAIARLSRTVLPLGAASALTSLQTNIPRFYIALTLTQADLGIYAALGYVVVAGEMVITALGHAISPRLSRAWVNRQVGLFARLLVRSAGASLGIGLLGALAALSLGPWLLRLLYTEAFAHYHRLFALLLGVGAISYAGYVLGYGLVTIRATKSHLGLMVLVTAVLALGARLLIPEFGLTGAALGSLGGALVQVAGAALILHRRARDVDRH